MTTNKNHGKILQNTTIPFSITNNILHYNHFTYQKFLQVYTDAFYFHLQHQEIRQKIKVIISKIDAIERNLEQNDEISKQQARFQNLPRKRRQADAIQRVYQCHVHRCLRAYGTLGSLIQHQRLKHPDYQQ